MSTPFKMKGFSGFGNSPMKQKSDTTKTYPEGYTEEDDSETVTQFKKVIA